MLNPNPYNAFNQSLLADNLQIRTISLTKKSSNKRSNECKNEPCPSNGTWRSNVGMRGGGKGWCGDCLKAEENKKLGFFRDDYYVLYFNCQSCT